MKLSIKYFILSSCFIFTVLFSTSYAQSREGIGAGVIYSSVTATNPWVGEPTEISTGKWSIPINYSQYGDGLHFDVETNLSGWILLMLLGDGIDTPATPAFKENNNFSFVDINIASFRAAVDLLEIGILTGGQVGFGYKGVDATDKTTYQYFEKDNYVSYGANIGTGFNIGDQYLHALFHYDWISMGDDKKGNSWGVDIEFFPFSASSDYEMIRFKLYTKSTRMAYPEKIAGPNFEYSDIQIGGGIILSNIL